MSSRADQPLLLVPPARRDRRSQHALGRAYFAAGDPGDLVDVSGRRRRSKLESPPGAAQQFLAFLVSRPAQRSSPRATATSIRFGRVSTDPRLARSLASLHPAPVTVADLGDGAKSLQPSRDSSACSERPRPTQLGIRPQPAAP